MGEDLVSPDVIFKVVIVGDAAVGKTCLLNRYLNNTFTPTTSTVGIGYGAKTLEISHSVIKLQIWDTAGQENFRSIARTFYKGTHGVILTYSLRKATSFEHLESWIKEIKDGTDEGTPIVLVGNMKDLEQEREVTEDQAAHMCQAHGLAEKFEVSAASGLNVASVSAMQPFQALGSLMLQRASAKPDRRRGQKAGNVIVSAPKAQEAAAPQKKKKKGCF